MQSSELILNSDGSIYHLHLHPEDISDTIITVGDPNRVADVSKYFDTIEIKKAYREFVTHTGHLNGKRLTVISTGIGTDNIDIVLNELDALVNIDLKTRKVKDKLRQLQFIRVGTSGCLRPEIPVDSLLISEYAVGWDGLGFFYKKNQTAENENFYQSLKNKMPDIPFYTASASPFLVEQFASSIFNKGITLTCSGFYAPQIRQLRLPVRFPNFFEKIQAFSHKNLHITNMEMETAGIYLLAQMLGHQAISINALLANRMTGNFSKNPQLVVENMIKKVLKILTH
ncbi:MAG: nucleoside phosphorylase [Saprospiraceae bacterium]